MRHGVVKIRFLRHGVVKIMRHGVVKIRFLRHGVVKITIEKYAETPMYRAFGLACAREKEYLPD